MYILFRIKYSTLNYYTFLNFLALELAITAFFVSQLASPNILFLFYSIRKKNIGPSQQRRVGSKGHSSTGKSSDSAHIRARFVLKINS